ncbi:phosphatase domain-containing protein [Litoreibacter albidus]|uniref:Phosphatidate phosphatase APP1 n=1 Tax=Litoreibacter albidus TaxID=670155 RepID=A0A1H2VKP0_9RHOB|nr:phosphatase domain-containing protein [Litoreibacter albidus]SDW68906.1 Phosphatidate phosphatase APP1 [Litoreibacter albidus]
MIKRVLHKIALIAERGFDRVFHRPTSGREIDPYIGYATQQHVIVRGRVLGSLRSYDVADGQSRWGNFRRMLDLFFTNEVADVTVCSDATKAQTDEEGYFTLVLPADEREGWSTEYVHVEGRAEAVPCPVFAPRADARFIVISDIDDTMIETGAYSLLRNLFTTFTGNTKTRHAYTDAISLTTWLSAGGRNPVFYVSSSPWNMHGFLQRVFANTGLIAGPMFLRDLGLSDTQFITEGHGDHKGASIDHILNAYPDLPAILLGDTGQHDAKIYHAAIERHGDRIAAVGLRAPGPGMDAVDLTDLDQLLATKRLAFAAPSFDGFQERLIKARPDLFATPDSTATVR